MYVFCAHTWCVMNDAPRILCRFMFCRLQQQTFRAAWKVAWKNADIDFSRVNVWEDMYKSDQLAFFMKCNIHVKLASFLFSQKPNITLRKCYVVIFLSHILHWINCETGSLNTCKSYFEGRIQSKVFCY